MLLEVQCEVSTVSDDLGCHVICWCWSTVFSEVKFKFKFKLSFIVIPLHVGTYSGTKCRASQDHGAT